MDHPPRMIFVEVQDTVGRIVKGNLKVLAISNLFCLFIEVDTIVVKPSE